MSYDMKKLIRDIHALAEAFSKEDKQKVEFTHDSGFNSVQGKYSLVCDTRGLVLASEESCQKEISKREVKDMSDNALRYNEYGELVYPPARPQPPKELKTDRWKNITPKRMEKILQYEVDREGYEIAMAMYHYKMNQYLKMSTNKVDKMESIINYMREHGRLVVDKPGLVAWSSLPQDVGVEHHKAHIMSWEESLRFNPDKKKANPQTTLDGHVRYAPSLRVVDFDIITSFGVKPNFLLEKSWLLHLLNGESLSETERQFLRERKELGRKMRGY